MVKFPLKFETNVVAPGGVQTPWKGQAGKLSPIPCAIPAEFMGPGGAYSPEDLFGLSILSCLVAMAKVYCEKKKLTFRELRGRAVATMEMQEKMMITQIDIFLEMTGASDIEKCRAALQQAADDCPVSNSIKSGKTFHLEIR